MDKICAQCREAKDDCMVAIDEITFRGRCYAASASQSIWRQQEYPRTGIGLAICQKVVGRHGGTVWVQSELETSSSFYFTRRVRKELKTG